MIDRIFEIILDIAAITAALHVSPADTQAIFTDPRTATPIIKRRIAAGQQYWSLRGARGGVEQLYDPDGSVWIVKTISDHVDFRPSRQIGVGRSTDDEGVEQHWTAVGGYLLLDVSELPRVRVYQLSIAHIGQWHHEGKLSADYGVGRETLMQDLLPTVRFDR